MLPRKDFLTFSKPRFGEEEIQEIISTIREGWVGTGPRTAQFEKEFAEYVGAPYAIALNSCTAALHLAYVTLDLKPGDEVIVPAMTFGATANAIIHAGGRPVFVDITSDRLAIDVAAAERAITPRTKAIVAVHFAGRMAPIEDLAELCKKRGLILIEDCAHAIETTSHGRHAGTFGHAGCFSFYANKNVSTAEGGMFVTQSQNVAERVRKLSLHGMSKDAHKRFTAAGYAHYSFDEFGFKYNMPDLAAALGLHQLRRIEKNRAHRQKIWSIYMEGLRTLPVGLPAFPSPQAPETHALHLFQIRVDPAVRDRMLQAYAKEKIGVGVHYQALVDFPIYQQFLSSKDPDIIAKQFPVSRAFGAQTISLPLGTDMSEEDARDVVEATAKILKEFLRL